MNFAERITIVSFLGAAYVGCVIMFLWLLHRCRKSRIGAGELIYPSVRILNAPFANRLFWLCNLVVLAFCLMGLGRQDTLAQIIAVGTAVGFGATALLGFSKVGYRYLELHELGIIYGEIFATWDQVRWWRFKDECPAKLELSIPQTTLELRLQASDRDVVHQVLLARLPDRERCALPPTPSCVT